MDLIQFWKIVDLTRVKANGDPGAHIDALRAALLTLDADDIVAFDRIYREQMARAYSWDLWGAAYIIGGGCSDDGFTDFRAWLVSKGKAVYEAALRDADSLADVITDVDDDAQFEEFTYAASQAWEEKLKKRPEDFPCESSVNGDDLTGEAWEEESDDLAERFPKLWAKFSD